MLNSIQKEFNRRSKSYQDYNFLQKTIAKELLSLVKTTPKTILDLGSGNGEVVKNIPWSFQHFIAIEFATNMRKAHPKADNISVLDRDFNSENFLANIDKQDLIISSSSLQWADNLENTLQEIEKKTENIAFAIFSDNTFKTLRETAKIDTHLLPAKSIIETVKKYFPCHCETKQYQLNFSSKEKLFHYIKRSGVSGGERKLSFKQTKDLINNYPFLTLEAEVVFCVSNL